MNGFERHGIKHLSASSLNMFVGSPSAWVASKLMGHKLGVGIAAHKGTATEAGVAHILKNGGAEVDEGVEIAFKLFNDLTAMGGYSAEDKEAARVSIFAMIANACTHLVDLGPPDFPESGQHMIEIGCRYGPEPEQTIKFIGYLDFVYPARKLIVDLKTTSRLPSNWSAAHGIQAALYARASGFDVNFLYTSPAKTKLLVMEDPAPYLDAVKRQVARMERFLSLGDAETLLAATPHDPSSFYWSGSDARDIEKALFG